MLTHMYTPIDVIVGKDINFLRSTINKLRIRLDSQFYMDQSLKHENSLLNIYVYIIGPASMLL